MGRNRQANLTDGDKIRIAHQYRQRIRIKIIAANHGRALSTINNVIAELEIPRRYNITKGETDDHATGRNAELEQGETAGRQYD